MDEPYSPSASTPEERTEIEDDLATGYGRTGLRMRPVGSTSRGLVAARFEGGHGWHALPQKGVHQDEF
ncbi:hypothetical protein BDA96_02G162000 [Sorghum bicolor]|uniref:Uncharacterized protein n=2 Tax=Sorghum bicolor TaxID=4558 RepID=A0A921RMF7_SORBI|nr:hypothetical protein BDA96_02G162000 [Sorghum bicolor]OQU89174.1 hypothetical protein SORBI_3002G155301 [Sorghum bicolor]